MALQCIGPPPAPSLSSCLLKKFNQETPRSISLGPEMKPSGGVVGQHHLHFRGILQALGTQGSRIGRTRLDPVLLSPHNKVLTELPYSQSVAQRESPKKAHFGIPTDSQAAAFMMSPDMLGVSTGGSQWGADPLCSSRDCQFQFCLYPFTFKHALAKHPLSNSRCHH